MTRKLQNKAARVLLVLVGLIFVGAATGCDELLYPGYLGTSPYWGTYYPDYGLYVIDYRLEVMEWSNDGWDEFIRQ